MADLNGRYDEVWNRDPFPAKERRLTSDWNLHKTMVTGLNHNQHLQTLYIRQYYIRIFCFSVKRSKPVLQFSALYASLFAELPIFIWSLWEKNCTFVGEAVSYSFPQCEHLRKGRLLICLFKTYLTINSGAAPNQKF